MDIDIRSKFWTAFATSPIVMIRLEGSHEHAEPMRAHFDGDAPSVVWFFCRRDNRIGKGGRAMAQVATIDHTMFACASGALVEERDPAARARYWDDIVETWFPGGKSDPAVLMLRFEIEDAEVWIANAGTAGSFRLAIGGPLDPKLVMEHETGAL